jgi:putative hydrolase of the HAD superfamily
MVPGADVKELWRDLEDRHFDAYLAGEISHSEQRRRRVADLHTALDRPTPPGWFAAYLAEYERAWTAFSGARPTLERLDLKVNVCVRGVEPEGELAGIGDDRGVLSIVAGSA